IAGVAAILGAILVLAGLRSKRLGRTALLAVASYFGVSLLGVVVYPAIVQKFVVAPNELSKETPQLRRHIDATRRAWGLDRVLVRDLAGEARLTERDIQANRPTIDNVRLWDRDPLLQTFGQLQEIRTYYDFVSVDDDRYIVDGRYRQVMLSPRELNSASLPTRTFINERLTFTHGMGLTLGPVNEVTEEGLPVLFIKDLPPASAVSLAVKRHHEREPRDVHPQHPRARAYGAAVFDLRRRPVHGDRWWRAATLDPRCLHRDDALSVRAAAAQRRELHAQQREGRDRRVRRLRHRLSGRRRRSAGPNLCQDLSGDFPPARFDAGRSARASALSRGPVSRPDRAVRHLSHGGAGHFLSSRGPVAEAGAVDRAGAARSVPAPHGDAAAGGKPGGVHSHGAVHAARQGQPGVVDGGAERRRALRRAGR